MDRLTDFITNHLDEDTSRLLLNRSKWPEIDMETVVNSIESRRKLRGKVKEWHDETRLVFPLKLSAEQCSSSATALYKTMLAERIAGSPAFRIADLTGGLGVDSWYFSKKAAEVLYNEMQSVLCKAARHNFRILGAGNIVISNCEISAGNISDILTGFCPDIVYMDPARRSESGRKVFLIEECTPDVLTLKDGIFRECRHILLKLSPMADISMACSRLGSTCREIHVVAYGGECKELLIWMDREWSGEYSVHAVELPNDYPSSMPHIFSFLPSEEREAVPDLLQHPCGPDAPSYIFEPGKSLMKAGAFNLISKRSDIKKFGRSTHYYIFHDTDRAVALDGLGKIYRIMRSEALDKRSIKAAGRDFPKAEVTARNIPMDTETLRKKLGVTSGDDAHIFGLKSDFCGNLLLCTQRVFQKNLQSHCDKDESPGKFGL